MAMIGPAVLGLHAALFSTAVLAQPECLVTESSAGPLRLGMTIGHARQLLAPLSLERTSTGDGAALVAVQRGTELVMLLDTGQADADGPINERGRIVNIEVLDSHYRSAQGLQVGMPLAAAEQRAGPLRKIVGSDNEAREFATFARQPRRLWIRVVGDEAGAGIYAKGQRNTRRYNADAHIHGLSAVGNGRRIPPIDPSGPVLAARPCDGGG